MNNYHFIIAVIIRIMLPLVTLKIKLPTYKRLDNPFEYIEFKSRNYFRNSLLERQYFESNGGVWLKQYRNTEEVSQEELVQDIKNLTLLTLL
jgi:hypothetical protein